MQGDDIERYARHLVLKEIGGPGQARLASARVLVVGAGGLGSAVLPYLAAAGIGHIGIIDDDKVSLSNLQRQIIHGTPDLGRPKVQSAAEALTRINPAVKLTLLDQRITEDNAQAIISGYDIVADGSDNFDTRYAVSDACFHAARPLVTASVNEFDGAITTIRAHERSADGTPNPTYRCLFPEKPAPGIIPTCSEVGVLGALTGVIGTLQAMEIIREIVGFGEGLVGKQLLVDAKYLRFETIRYSWSPANPLTGTRSS